MPYCIKKIGLRFLKIEGLRVPPQDRFIPVSKQSPFILRNRGAPLYALVHMTARPSKARLLLFAFGDFAFNLFWQSIMLFLLFYYTDALSLPIGVAATTYMIASIWDGIANFVAGVLVDRKHDRFRYGPLLIAGAVPLGRRCAAS